MSKRQWTMIFGILIICLPYLGLPDSWDKFVLMILGLLIIVLAYSAKSSIEKGNGVHPYIDHKNEK